MRCLKIKFAIVVLVVLAMACKKRTGLIVPENFRGIMYVREWKAIGPFKFDTLKQQSNSTFYNKDLELFGVNEGFFTENDLVKLTSTAYKPFIIKYHDSPIPFIDYTDKNAVADKSSFYLFTKVYSKVEQEVVLIFDGTRNYKIWFNKQQILEVLDKSSAAKIGDRFVKVRLLKGVNTLFAKVNRGSNLYSWKLSMAISSTDIAKKIYRENYLTDFINNPLFKDSLQTYLGPYSEAKLAIKNDEGMLLTSDLSAIEPIVTTIDTKKIPLGLFESRLILENDTLTQVVFKGDIFQYINVLKEKAKRIKSDKPTANDIKATVERLDFLKEKSDFTSESSSKYYSRNLLYYTVNLKNLLRYIEMHGNDRFYSGSSLKTYISKENAVNNQFLLHINKKLIGKKPMPLILFVPYTLSDTTMIRSWYIGNLDQMEMDTKLAEKYGFAVAWLFLNGYQYNESNAVADTKGVIARIKNDYNLDESKIFLVGECEGGKRALLIAETRPQLFAGIAVSSPETGDPHSPLRDLDKLSKMQICVQHGIHDNVVPMSKSEDFVNQARKSGASIKFLKTETGHINISRDERRYAFTFFDSIRRTLKPRIVKHN